MPYSSRQTARLLAAAGAVCCGVFAAACGTVATSSSPPQATDGTSTPASPSSGSPGSSTEAACATSALRGSLPAVGGAAAGHTYYPLSLTNDSAASCTLYGYPGVSFVSSPGGSQIGAAAARSTSAYVFQAQPPQTVTLAPGQTAHAGLQLVTFGDFPASQCDVVTAHWVRVYPPNQTAPLYISFTAQTCTQGPGLLTVSPVQPVGSPVQPFDSPSS